YRWALELRPDNAPALTDLTEYTMETSGVDEAIAVFERFTDRKPSFHAMAHVAKELMRAGRQELAEQYAVRAVAADLKDTFALIIYARLLFNTKRYEASEQHARKALAIDPDYADAYLLLADALEAQGHAEERLSALRTGLDQQPGDPRILTS